MATYSCRLYQDTGFNAVNIPDGPGLLEQCAHFDASALSIMQDRFLSEIRVRVSWDQVKNCDYIRLGTVDPQFYFINSISMLAKDVALLSVSIDYVTSGGGVSSLQILDGITKRVHVTDDTFGKYCEDDPLTAPAQPLELQMAWTNISSAAHTYVEATINLPKTGIARDGVSYSNDQYVNDPSTEAEDVVVPTVVDLDKFTTYECAGVNAGVNPHTMLYDLNNTDKANGAEYNNQQAVLQGMKRARELGIEQGAIINQVQIPTDYAECPSGQSDYALFGYNGPKGEVKTTNRWISTFRGKTGTADSNILFEYTGATNKRVNYGEYTKYGIISCSGESCEYNAEDLMDSNSPNYPVLKYIADPHTDGRPYFRWRVVNRDSSDIGFFKNCVTGLQWKQVPLYFKDPSGSAINALKYSNSRKMAATEYQNWDLQRNYELGSASVKGMAGMITSAGGNISMSESLNRHNEKLSIGGNVGSYANSTGMVNSFIGLADAIGNYIVNEKTHDRSYFQAKRNELSEYLVDTYVKAPTINFPYNSEVLRDFYGNGCLMYRYKYSSADIRRIDKLLTMYGYRHTKALEASDFMNRQNFNYVECSNITVSGHAKWMNDGISMMLSNGVRIWHKLPNPAYYTQANPNR